jgi:hypothetical protein
MSRTPRWWWWWIISRSISFTKTWGGIEEAQTLIMYQLSLNALSLSWPSQWPRLSCERNLRNRLDNPNYVSSNRLLFEDITYCKMCVLNTLLPVDLPDSTDLQRFTVWTEVDVQILQSKLCQAICWDRITWLAHLQLQQKREWLSDTY